MIIRPTAILAKKLGLEVGPNSESNSKILEDWHANYFRLGKVHLVLFTDSETLLPIVIKAAPYKDLFIRFQLELNIYLKSLGYEDISKSLDSSLKTGKPMDRSITGVMVRFVDNLKFYYEDGHLHPEDIRGMTMDLSDQIVGSKYRAAPLDLLKRKVVLFKG